MAQTPLVRGSVGSPLLAKEVVAVAIGLFGLSFATALFTLAIFKLLGFFIMPSLFFDLLFIGFPLARSLRPTGCLPAEHRFWDACGGCRRRWWCRWGAACWQSDFDYLRAHLFDIDLAMLVGQIAVFVGLFLPFFAAYGMSEYLGYQYGRSRLGGRMRLVYALALSARQRPTSFSARPCRPLAWHGSSSSPSSP